MTTIELEYEKIKLNPVEYICDYMDANLLHVGKAVFKVLALQPCSLLLPDIPFGSTNIRATFNTLYISPPSTGKSTTCKKFSKMTYHPYIIRKTSSAKLRKDLSQMQMFSLIIEDFSELGEGADSYEVIKVIEGALGDEKSIKKNTLRESIDADTQGIGLLCGTWADLNRYFEYFKSGLFFRMVFLFVDLSDEQLSEIGRFINNGIGNKSMSTSLNIKEKVIEKYYNELSIIQAEGEKEAVEPQKIHKVKEYYFDSVIKEKMHYSWESTVKRAKEVFQKSFNARLEYSFTRELHEGYRFLISHAFLNVFNRKVDENGVLYPNMDDCNYANDLMLMNLNNKLDVLKSKAFLKAYGHEGLRTIDQHKIPPKTKKILMNISQSRHKL